MNRRFFGVICVFLFLVGNLLICQVEAGEGSLSLDLEKGIGEYKHENYDEALIFLIRARKQNPELTLAAYYLGLNYKQMQDYENAVIHLRDAVTYTPKIKGALIELIDCLYHYGLLKEARDWIKEAEKEGIRPAKVQFLKGLVMMKEEYYIEAITAFEEAKERDKLMEQASNYQIGIAQLKSTEMAEAEIMFQNVISIKPSSNLAQYAEEYIRVITKQKKEQDSVRFSIGTSWQYDDNVVLSPEDDSLVADITDQEDWRMVYTGRMEYQKRLKKNISLKGEYSFYYGDQHELNFFDTMSHSVAVQPSLYFEKNILSFPITYTHTIVDDRSYLSNVTGGFQYNALIGSSGMGQLFFRYNHKEYLWTPSSPDEDRDAEGITGGLGYFWFFANKKGFLNIGYAVDREAAKGANWEYTGHRINSSVLIPFTDKWKVTLSGNVYFQDFEYRHTVLDQKRQDDVYTFSTLIAYKFYNDSELQVQYTYVKDDSTINFFTYDRNIISTGVQVKF